MSEMKCKRCGADEMTDFTKEFIAEARESITEPGVERYICIPVQLEMLDEIERLQSRIAELEALVERLIELGYGLFKLSKSVGLKMSPNGRSVRTVSNWEKTMKEWDDSVPDGIKYLSAEKQVLMRRVRELESENARLKDAQRWIPVSERLPEEKQKILITWAPKYSQIFSAIFGTGFTDWTFTHWMPLPQLPEVNE